MDIFAAIGRARALMVVADTSYEIVQIGGESFIQSQAVKSKLAFAWRFQYAGQHAMRNGRMCKEGHSKQLRPRAQSSPEVNLPNVIYFIQHSSAPGPWRGDSNSVPQHLRES